MQYVRDDGAGLLVILKLNEKSHHSQIARHLNVLDEQYFLYNWPTRHLNVLDEQYFLYNWPSRATIIDARDARRSRRHAQTRVDILQGLRRA